MKLLIFTYAATGLGHLRVADALMDTRPGKTSFVLVDDNDTFVNWVHRFTSLNPIGKFIFVRSQYGIWEKLFARFYVRFLITHTDKILERFKEVIGHSGDDVDEIWIITTHFGMAHQLGAIKNKLISATGKTIKLAVQVTDDTYQRLWCVRGADITFLPSEWIKERFESYASSKNIDFNGVVTPYPLSPLLTKDISPLMGKRSDVFENNGEIRIAVPISGAAVGLPYIINLIIKLHELSERFEFWVIVKKTPYTAIAISILKKIPKVIVIVGETDTEMVDLYEQMYERNLMHLEITKPSEQTFKAILHPDKVGGSVLLFTEPVGRQEMDNLDFLRRHKLVSKQPKDQETLPIDKQPKSLRSIILSDDATMAARFIFWAMESGLFARMTGKNFTFSKKSLTSREIGPDGTKLFWKKLEEKFGK